MEIFLVFKQKNIKMQKLYLVKLKFKKLLSSRMKSVHHIG